MDEVDCRQSNHKVPETRRATEPGRFALSASWAHHLWERQSLQGTCGVSHYSYHCSGRCLQKILSVHAWRPHLQSNVLVSTSHFHVSGAGPRIHHVTPIMSRSCHHLKEHASPSCGNIRCSYC